VRIRLARVRERDWKVLDRLLVLGLLVIGEVETLTSSEVEGPLVPNMVLVAAVAGSLLFRRSRPVVTILVMVVAATCGQLFLTGPPGLFSETVMLFVATYSVGAHAERREAFIGLAIAATAVVTISIFDDPSDIFFPLAFFVVAPWLIGRTLRNHLMLARELAEKAERAEHAREEEEGRALAAERNRIARELHDVLAHNLSVMVVQAAAGRRLLERDPDRAAEVAQLIERTGREALAELRHVFGPVRRGDGEPLQGPPSLERVDQLARRAREAGLPVELRVDGEPGPLPAGVDLAAYRVVQEALTNALKHAGAASASVRVGYSTHEVLVEVSDDGRGPGGNGGTAEFGGGHGLVGMRERVALYGGELEAGRRRGGGFLVRARLPLAREAVR
jgi:signal transduction histidine kinase